MHEPLTPPEAKSIPFEFQHLGRTFSDPFAWLQNLHDPQVMAYIDTENAYTDDMLAHTAALQQQLFNEMRGRIAENETSVPERRGNHYYYTRFEAGKQYRIFCRKSGGPEAPEEILLDENELALGKEYCSVRIFTPSPDQNLLAFAVDTTGSWVFDLFIKDLRTGQIVAGPIPNTAWTLAWASDSQTVFYTVFDHAHRADRLYCCPVGSGMDPTLVYEEKDESFSVYVRRSCSGDFLFLNLKSSTTAEVHFLAAGRPRGDFQCIEARQHRHEYSVEHHGGRFLILSNAGAENFQLLQAPIDQPGRANWRVILPHSQQTYLEEMVLFKDFLVLFERGQGLPHLRISDPDGVSHVHEVVFPEEAYAVFPEANPEFESDLLRFKYTSLVTPLSTVDYGLRTRTWEVKQQQEIPSGYDPGLYETHRLFAPSVGGVQVPASGVQVPASGVQVPISVVHRKGIELDGSHPLLMYGYGSYGYSAEIFFQSVRLSLLERGFVFAIAHIRGGSEMGRAWYEDGRLRHKKNTFQDFIACAEHLISLGYTSPEKLAILGGSAGGLLVTAAANLRPDLFKTVLALVPFTNVITAMLDPNLPLTVVEYEQWGNPGDEAAFDYMLSYSPYENIAAKGYPHIYARTGIHDLQVPYWDPLKWVARLRSMKTDANRLVLRIQKGAGHGGASGRYNHLYEEAEMYAFLLDTLGLLNTSPGNT